MGTVYEKTSNYQLDLYGNNDPADLRDGYNNSMRTIDDTLGKHLNRIEGVESRETHDEAVVKALLGDNTVDNATTAKTQWDKAAADATSADNRLTSIGVTDITSGAALRESVSRTNAILPSCVVTFDNIESMRDSNLLTDGMQCRTLGFYKVGDGGGAHYVMHAVGGNATANGMDAISCKNNLIAELVADNNFLNVKRYGAQAYGVQLRTPQNAIISGLLVTGDESVGDSEAEPTHNLKTIGNGIIISDMNEISNFTVDCESNAVPFSKTDNYTTQEIEKIIYVNQYASTEEKDNTYGRVRFRNSMIKVTKGIVEIQ